MLSTKFSFLPYSKGAFFFIPLHSFGSPLVFHKILEITTRKSETALASSTKVFYEKFNQTQPLGKHLAYLYLSVHGTALTDHSSLSIGV